MILKTLVEQRDVWSRKLGYFKDVVLAAVLTFDENVYKIALKHINSSFQGSILPSRFHGIKENNKVLPSFKINCIQKVRLKVILGVHGETKYHDLIKLFSIQNINLQKLNILWKTWTYS